MLKQRSSYLNALPSSEKEAFQQWSTVDEVAHQPNEFRQDREHD
jgi:hypothetical protein